MIVKGMATLTKLIFERAQPKRLGAQVITGPMLATLASEYVRAINEGAVPTISTAWQVWMGSPSARFAGILLRSYIVS